MLFYGVAIYDLSFKPATQSESIVASQDAIASSYPLCPKVIKLKFSTLLSFTIKRHKLRSNFYRIGAAIRIQ